MGGQLVPPSCKLLCHMPTARSVNRCQSPLPGVSAQRQRFESSGLRSPWRCLHFFTEGNPTKGTWGQAAANNTHIQNQTHNLLQACKTQTYRAPVCKNPFIGEYIHLQGNKLALVQFQIMDLSHLSKKECSHYLYHRILLLCHNLYLMD